jgi:hypothetical protein
MKTLARFALISCLSAAILPAPLHAAADSASAPAAKEEGGKKKKKKKKKKEADQQMAAPTADSTGSDAKASIGGSKESIVPPAAPLDGGWCAWLQNDPGLLYENKENPWIQSFEIGGRFHYQAAYLEGTDINGLDFNDTYDE